MYLKIIPDDIELAIKLQKGDTEAFDLLYFKYAGQLLKMLLLKKNLGFWQ